jgi:hypothetical protein
MQDSRLIGAAWSMSAMLQQRPNSAEQRNDAMCQKLKSLQKEFGTSNRAGPPMLRPNELLANVGTAS